MAPGFFEIETIPRTGYRLTGDILAHLPGGDPEAPSRAPTIDRRAVVAGAAAILVAGVGVAWWSKGGSANSQEAERLIERGRQVLRESVPQQEQAAIAMLHQAVELDPKNSEAWGLLALAYRAHLENGAAGVVTEALRRSELAARRAIEIDPDNGNALTALTMLRPEFGNWQTAELQLREALERDPTCVAAMNFLTLVLQSVGRSSESFRWNEKAAKLDPLDVTPQYRLAMKNWIFGRIDDADLVLNRGLQIWPFNPALWNTRLVVLTYSGRLEEAMRYLDQSLAANPKLARTAGLWRVTLQAHLTRDEAVRARARDFIKQRASLSSAASVHAIMALSNLGMTDDAFEVADGYYRWRGPVAGAEKFTPRETLLNDQLWRRTMLLFTPATRAMRFDPRFDKLTKGIGLNDYWRRTGTRPDAFLFR